MLFPSLYSSVLSLREKKVCARKLRGNLFQKTRKEGRRKEGWGRDSCGGTTVTCGSLCYSCCCALYHVRNPTNPWC